MIEVHYRHDGDCTIMRLKNDCSFKDGIIFGYTEKGKWMAIKDWVFACEVEVKDENEEGSDANID